MVTFKEKRIFLFTSLVLKKTYANCSLANFNRVASSHEMLYYEQWGMFYYFTFYYDFLVTHL